MDKKYDTSSPKKKLAYHLFDKSKARLPSETYPIVFRQAADTWRSGHESPMSARTIPVNAAVENRLMCSSKCSWNHNEQRAEKLWNI